MIDLFSFAVLGLVLTLRLPPYVSSRTLPGPALWSVIFGVLALLARGVVIPAPLLDAVLGGVNYLHLVRNLLVVAAVWCLRRAVADEIFRSSKTPGYTRPRHRLAALFGLMAAVSILFTLTATGPTTETFIPQYAHLDAIWAYASTYMVGVALMAADVGRLSRWRFRSYLGFFTVGASIMCVSSIVELGYMWMIHFDQGTDWERQLSYWFFQIFFYVGIASIAIGLSVRPVDTTWSVRLRIACAQLAAAVPLPKASSNLFARGWTVFWSKDLQSRAYDLLIQTRDFEILNEISFPPKTRALARLVERILTTAEAEIPKEIAPKNG